MDLYALSKGGRGAMTQRTWQTRAMLKGQYQRLQEFEAALRDGNLPSKARRIEPELYINSARQVFSEANGAAQTFMGWMRSARLHPAEHQPGPGGLRGAGMANLSAHTTEDRRV